MINTVPALAIEYIPTLSLTSEIAKVPGPDFVKLTQTVFSVFFVSSCLHRICEHNEMAVVLWQQV